jgi:hypothetical protein
VALTLYTKPEDDNLIKEAKIKALNENISVSEVTLKLLKKWIDGEVTIEQDNGGAK